ncbi:MAG: peptide MFS transporter [Pseudomonadota bacterium]
MAAALDKYMPSFLKGHHPGLGVMAMTEIWERLAYYGMRAILVLFLVDTAQGFSLDEDYAASVYGLFLSVAYMTSLMGGWFGDRVLGSVQAIMLGAIFMMIGNFILALSAELNVFYLGLFFIVLGLSLLKPNISAVISFLYPEGGARRDTAFYIFYLAINVGALIGPFVTATAAAMYGFRAGFACAGIGMILGIAQLAFAIKFKTVTLDLGAANSGGRIGQRTKLVAWACVALVVAMILLILFGDMEVEINAILDGIGVFLLFVAIGYFSFLFLSKDLTIQEKKGVGGLLILFFGAILFYLGLSQPGSSFNLFTDDYTNKTIWGFDIPTGWFQAINPAFTLLLTPFFTWLWVNLDEKDKNPPVVAKFAIAIMCTAVAFAAIGYAALNVTEDALASPWWLVLTYFAQTCAEIILIPIGLSFVTKLMPDRYVGQGMGIWFLSVSIGYLLGGRYAGAMDYDSSVAMGQQFLWISGVFAISSIIMFAIVRVVRPLFKEVE